MGRGDRLSSMPGRGADAVMPGGPRWGGGQRDAPSSGRAPFFVVVRLVCEDSARRVAGCGGPGPFREQGDGTCGDRGQRRSGNPRGRASPASQRSVPGRRAWKGAHLPVNRPRPDGRQPRAQRAGEELGSGGRRRGVGSPPGQPGGPAPRMGTPTPICFWARGGGRRGGSPQPRG